MELHIAYKYTHSHTCKNATIIPTNHNLTRPHSSLLTHHSSLTSGLESVIKATAQSPQLQACVLTGKGKAKGKDTDTDTGEDEDACGKGLGRGCCLALVAGLEAARKSLEPTPKALWHVRCALLRGIHTHW